MTRAETKKAIYESIFKEGKSHQLTFDTLLGDTDMQPEMLAKAVSMVPSRAKREQWRIWNYIYIALLGAFCLLRMLAFFSWGFLGEMAMSQTLILILLSVWVPYLGIRAALTARMESYHTIGIVLIINVFQSFKIILLADPTIWTGTIFALSIIFLSFFLPFKLKTPYKQVVEAGTTGTMTTTYVFDEQSGIAYGDLLDDFKSEN